MRLAIAVVLAFIVMAGGLAAVIAVLVIVFNLAWEAHLASSPAQQPGDRTTPGAGQAVRTEDDSEVHRPGMRGDGDG